MTQEVEHLLCKQKAQVQTPVPPKKKERRKEGKGGKKINSNRVKLD
jgi:hypothetical protein